MALIDIVVANPLTMRQEIVLAYNLPKNEFNQLGGAYPLGKYYRHAEKSHWFSVKTDFFDMDGHVCGNLELIWFVEWRV